MIGFAKWRGDSWVSRTPSLLFGLEWEKKATEERRMQRVYEQDLCTWDLFIEKSLEHRKVQKRSSRGQLRSSKSIFYKFFDKNKSEGCQGHFKFGKSSDVRWEATFRFEHQKSQNKHFRLGARFFNIHSGPWNTWCERDIHSNLREIDLSLSGIEPRTIKTSRPTKTRTGRPSTDTSPLSFQTHFCVEVRLYLGHSHFLKRQSTNTSVETQRSPRIGGIWVKLFTISRSVSIEYWCELGMSLFGRKGRMSLLSKLEQREKGKS